MRIKRLGVGVGMDRPWEPRDIPNISGHWDVGDSSTHTITAGRMAALADKSGLGRNLTEVGGSGPTYEAAGFNGRPSMVFDGAADYLIADAVAADMSGNDKPCTAIMAMQVVARGVSTYIWMMGEAGSDVHWYGAFDSGTNIGVRREDDGGVAKTVTGGVATGAARFVFSQVFNGTAVDTFLNATADLSAGDVDVGACTHNTFTIGCLRRAATGNFANIRVAEMIVYARALSDAERQRVEAYLEAKWFNPGEVPLRVPGLSGWWDASHTSTLTLSGSDVDQWDDKSGLGRNFTATVPPEYEAAGWNGLPSILFNGVDEFMIADAVAADFTGSDQPCTVVMAIEWVSLAANDRGWSFGNSASANPWFTTQTDGTNIDVQRRDDSPALKTGNGGVVANRRVWSFVFTGTAGSTYIEGVVDVNGADLDLGAMTVDRFTLGALRRDAGATNAANIRVSEMCIHKRALPAAERLKIESYLINKWSVS